jgi:hypothetical protein
MLRRFARKDGIIAIGEFTSQEFEYFLDVLHNECVYLSNIPRLDHNSCRP